MLICQNAEGVHGKKKVGNPGLDKLAIFIQRCCAFFCSAKVCFFTGAKCSLLDL